MVYDVAKYTIAPFYKLWLRKVDGMKNLPKEKPFIIAANHASYYDTVLPYAIATPVINKQIHALVNSRYWNILPAKIIVEWGKCIPVYVGKDSDEEKNKQSLSKAADFLRQGHIIQIFPEGTRSPDGRLKKGYNGVVKLALKAKVPVIPFGIINSNKVLSKGALFLRLERCDVKIGKPMHFDKYYGKKLNKEILGRLTRKVMNEIGKLIGQNYNY